MDCKNTAGLTSNKRSTGNKHLVANMPYINISQDRIVEVFLETGGLTTITPRPPLLIEPDDKEGGTKPFEKIIDVLFA